MFSGVDLALSSPSHPETIQRLLTSAYRAWQTVYGHRRSARITRWPKPPPGFRSTRRRWPRWDLRLSGAAMCAVAVWHRTDGEKDP
jgi:hypothetical protein